MGPGGRRQKLSMREKPWHDPQVEKFHAVLNEAATIFLLDVDNTLLDNDRFTADLGDRVENCFGAAQRARYWDIFAQPAHGARGSPITWGACKNFVRGWMTTRSCSACRSTCWSTPSPAGCFRAHSEAIAHLRTLGFPVVLSDGDIVFQPRKIQRSGIWTPWKAAS